MDRRNDALHEGTARGRQASTGQDAHAGAVGSIGAAGRIGTREMVLAGLFVALMIVGAKLKIPFPLVPLTFQGFFAILSGLLLGARTGLFAQLAYLLCGLMGFPVFSDESAGLEYVLRPTFGFLLGFALAAWLAGRISERLPTDRAQLPRRVFAASAAGLAAIYALGILYLFAIKNLYAGVPVALSAIAAGMAPFFIKDAVLFFLASVLAIRLIPVLAAGRGRSTAGSRMTNP